MANQHTIQATGRKDTVAGKLFHVRGAGILREVADLTGTGHLAARRQAFAGEDTRQGGLACAVTAHQADLVALVDAEAHLVHKEPGAGAEFKILDGNHSR